MHTQTRLVAIALMVAAALLSQDTPARARGGGPANIISSEGYQRALREERRLYQQTPPQVLKPFSAPRHRRHHSQVDR